VRFVRSHLRNRPPTIKSTSQLDSTVIEHSNDTNGDAIIATDELQLQNANRGSNSLSEVLALLLNTVSKNWANVDVAE
jgi:hypothetical protein